MATPPDPDTDAAFWAALGLELEARVERDDPVIEFVAMEGSDHVFHAAPPDTDAVDEPEPLPVWGEVFTW